MEKKDEKNGEKKKFFDVKKLAIAGILTAAITIVTAYIKIPVINGYVHIGDGLIYFAASLLGPFAALPAGIGSMLADLIAGYPQYILPTLIVKSLMGAISGLVLLLTNKTKKKWLKMMLRIVAIVICEGIMVIGYHIAGEIIYGEAAAIGELIGDLCQAGVGILTGIIFLSVASYFKHNGKYGWND
ncbi:MAG: ECF transporter S component [Clostridia bacterium]|nr:ECF transporter S component [Clostridia bacterium]